MVSAYKFKLKVLLTCIACLAVSALMAQKQDSIVYPVVIQFQSMCCGVPGDAPLREFIRSFKKKNKIKKIPAWHIGPMGKEGEYWLAFPLKELNKKQAAAFARQIKVVAEKLNDRGSALFAEKMKIITTELPARATIEKIIF